MRKRLIIGMVLIFAILFLTLGCTNGGDTELTENREPSQPVLHSPSDGEDGLAGNVSLSWLQSNDPDGDSIEYRVYYAREVSRLGSDYETVNDQTGIQLNGLASGTWWWRVEAADGQAAFSDSSEIWYFTVGSSLSPEASVEEDPDLMVESITDESFTLNWPEYSDSEDTDNDVEYEITVIEKENTAGKRGFNLSFNATTTDTELSVTGLEKAKQYRWVVLAKAENGNQTKIGESECKTGNNPPEAPEIVAPQNGETVEGTSVTLEWTAPEDSDGDEIKYNVYMDTEEDAEKLIMKNTTSTSLLVEDLQPATTYFWRVFAKDCSGGKSVGDTWHFRTSGERTGIPVVEWEETPDSTINTREFTFEWTAEDSDGKIVSYEYKKEVIEGEQRKHNVWKETENASYTWKNIPPVANRFSVRAIDNDGQYSDIIESTFVCDIAKPELEWTSKPSETIEEGSFEFEWQLVSESDIKTYKVKKETFGQDHGKKNYTSGWFFIDEDSYEWEEIPEGHSRFSVKVKDTENSYSEPLVCEFTVTNAEDDDEESDEELEIVWKNRPEEEITEDSFTFEWIATDTTVEGTDVQTRDIEKYEIMKKSETEEERDLGEDNWEEIKENAYEWSAIPEGENTFYVRAVNDNGIRSETLESEFDYVKKEEEGIPVIEWEEKPPETLEENTFEFEWDLVTEEEIEGYYIKKETIGSENRPGEEWILNDGDSYEWEKIPEGNNRFSVKAKDTENRYSEPLICEFTVTKGGD